MNRAGLFEISVQRSLLFTPCWPTRVKSTAHAPDPAWRRAPVHTAGELF